MLSVFLSIWVASTLSSASYTVWSPVASSRPAYIQYPHPYHQRPHHYYYYPKVRPQLDRRRKSPYIQSGNNNEIVLNRIDELSAPVAQPLVQQTKPTSVKSTTSTTTTFQTAVPSTSSTAPPTLYVPPRDIKNPLDLSNVPRVREHHTQIVYQASNQPKTVTSMDQPTHTGDMEFNLTPPDNFYDVTSNNNIENAFDYHHYRSGTSGYYHRPYYQALSSNDLGEGRNFDSQENKKKSEDVLVYDDIYPKRVPGHLWKARQQRQQRMQRLRHLKSAEDRLRTSPKVSRVRQLREQRARFIDADHDMPSNPSLLRSFLGVSPTCYHGEDTTAHLCTFTPSCWLSGGVPQPGCDSMLYSCCVQPNDARKDSSLVETGRKFSTASLKNHLVQVHEQPVVNEPECGIANDDKFSARIIGGERAKFAELPWQVHIRISSYQCGGVLLNRWFVATAAHCVHQAKLSQITVHLGEYDTKDTDEVNEPLDSESFKVDEVTLHPQFRYMLTQPDRFDVALLRLNRPVFYRENIVPICLPTTEYPLDGKVGVVAGWGKTDNSFGKTGTNLLNKVLVPIISNRQCRAWHKEKAIAVQLHDEMFCAGHQEGKRDACLGDSGGPLVINFDGKWTLVGITSAGFGCAVEKQPGIYHKVSKTARWIAHMIHKQLKK